MDARVQWTLGIVMATLGALFAALGDNFVKLSHRKAQARSETKGLAPIPLLRRPAWVAG